jgi:hypothetical protein
MTRSTRSLTLRCLVCDHTETQVEIDCPHCNKSVVMASEGYATCPALWRLNRA